jgi:hypothetical protein
MAAAGMASEALMDPGLGHLAASAQRRPPSIPRLMVRRQAGLFSRVCGRPVALFVRLHGDVAAKHNDPAGVEADLRRTLRAEAPTGPGGPAPTGHP